MKEDSSCVDVSLKSWDAQFSQAYPFKNLLPADYDRVFNLINEKHDKTLLNKKPVCFSLNDWDGNISPRRFIVRSNHLAFECYATHSPQKKLFVFLSAGGGQVKTGKRPEFQRASWHPWLDGICLNVADPTFSIYPGKLNTGWYFGSKDQDAILPLAKLIEKVKLQYNIEAKDVFIVGSSAGGTSALRLATVLDGVTAIAENPPFYPHKRGSSKRFLEAGIDLSSSEFLERNSLAGVVGNDASRYFVLQNAADKQPMKQLNDFLDKFGFSPLRLGLNAYGAFNVYCSCVPAQSPHHTFMSKDEFRNLHYALSLGFSGQALSLLLDSLYAGLKVRVLQNDKLKNLKCWSLFLSSLDLPELVLPSITDFHILKMPLVNNHHVVYRALLNHSGKRVTFSLDFSKITSLNDQAVLEICSRLDAHVIDKDGVSKLVISNVPIDKAHLVLGDFVRETLGFLK